MKLKDINIVPKLHSYLIKKGCNHNKGYSKYIEYNKNPKEHYDKDYCYLLFTDGSTWEDKKDKDDNFLSKRKTKKRFICCLTYLQSENIAMWKIYGKGSGYRIKIPQQLINKFITADHKTIVFLDEHHQKLEVNKTNITIQDVVYFSSNKTKDEKTYICRTDEKAYFPLIPNEFRDKAVEQGVQIKSDGWRYESEVRIIVDVDKNKVKDTSKLIYKFSKTDSKKIKFTCQPNFLDKDNSNELILKKLLLSVDKRNIEASEYDYK